MKRTSLFLASSIGFSMLLALSTLHPLGSGNPNNLFPSAQSAPSGLRADGDPPPPFPPHRPLQTSSLSESTVIADGDPPPPFPKPPQPPTPGVADAGFFIADGDPPPPLPPWAHTRGYVS